MYMEQASEKRECTFRAAAAVKASDAVLSVGSSSPSMQEHCGRRFGAKAKSFFTYEVDAALRFNMKESLVDEAGVQTVILTTVATGKHHPMLTLELGARNWRCECGIMVSRLVPCRHLIRYFQHCPNVTFEAFAPYFHDRWIMNTALPAPPR